MSFAEGWFLLNLLLFFPALFVIELTLGRLVGRVRVHEADGELLRTRVPPSRPIYALLVALPVLLVLATPMLCALTPLAPLAVAGWLWLLDRARRSREDTPVRLTGWRSTDDAELGAQLRAVGIARSLDHDGEVLVTTRGTDRPLVALIFGGAMLLLGMATLDELLPSLLLVELGLVSLLSALPWLIRRRSLRPVPALTLRLTAGHLRVTRRGVTEQRALTTLGPLHAELGDVVSEGGDLRLRTGDPAQAVALLQRIHAARSRAYEIAPAPPELAVLTERAGAER